MTPTMKTITNPNTDTIFEAGGEQYKPTSRRPIAGMLRRTADLAVRFCVARDIHPNTISYSSIVASLLAGVCFALAGRFSFLLLLAPAFLYLRLWFNMLDGMVALASGKASSRGEIVNELPDRISDIIIFVSLAASGLVYPWLGFAGAIAALLVAYIGVLGAGVGARREFGGVMSKPWRMVALHIGATAAWAAGTYAPEDVLLTPALVMNTALGLIIAGCVQTCVVRLRATIAILDVNAADAANAAKTDGR